MEFQSEHKIITINFKGKLTNPMYATKRAATVIVICLTLTTLSAQMVPMGTVAGKPAEIKSATQSVMNQLPMRPPETLGTVYLNEVWLNADIELANGNGQLKDVVVNLNLKTHDIEIEHKNHIVVLAWGRVVEFAIKNPDGTVHKFVNGKSYSFNGKPIRGFLQVFDSGKWELLVKHHVQLVKSNYNAALDVGERDNKYVKGETVFLAKGNELFELRGPRRTFCKQFGESSGVVSAFIKENHISLKQVRDLFKLVTFLNQTL